MKLLTSSPSKSEIRDEQQRSKRNNSHGARVYLDAADVFLCNSALGSVPKTFGRCARPPNPGAQAVPVAAGCRPSSMPAMIPALALPGPCAFLARGLRYVPKWLRRIELGQA